MNASIRDHMVATLSHLAIKRSKLLIELDQTESLIKGIKKEIASLEYTATLPFDSGGIRPYEGMSVRWSVFMYLAEYGGGVGTLNTIADALRSGGIASKGQSFNSNVSAVLSQMSNKGEIEKTGDRFNLTPHGQTVWEGIQKSEKFLKRADGEGSTEDGKPVLEAETSSVTADATKDIPW
jgi:DNA-binding MarR family transcriptional regulator